MGAKGQHATARPPKLLNSAYGIENINIYYIYIYVVHLLVMDNEVKVNVEKYLRNFSVR